MSEEQTAAAVAAAAKSVRRMFGLTLAAVIVAILVLAIDHGIKRDVLKAAGDARKTLEEFNARVLEAVIKDGTPRPDQAGPGHPADSGHDLDDAPRASAEADGHAANGTSPARSRSRRAAGGSRGDG